jgi:hypothetical protein
VESDGGHGGLERRPSRTRPAAAAAVTDEDCDLVECHRGGGGGRGRRPSGVQRWRRRRTRAAAAVVTDEGN